MTEKEAWTVKQAALDDINFALLNYKKAARVLEMTPDEIIGDFEDILIYSGLGIKLVPEE